MQKLKEFWDSHWRFIVVAALCMETFIAGWYSCKEFNANYVEVTVEKEVVREVPIEIPVEVKGETEVVYVEKESPDDSDVSITAEKPTIKMDYNGEQYEFETLSNETQKFDKGKLDINTSSTTTLDITPIVDREVTLAVENKELEMNKQFEEEVKEMEEKADKDKGKAKKNGFWTGVGAALGTGLLILAL